MANGKIKDSIDGKRAAIKALIAEESVDAMDSATPRSRRSRVSEASTFVQVSA